jgi:transcriptional regulator with XRE-family HTH domain
MVKDGSERGNGGRRTWLIAARESHSLSSEEATFLVSERKRLKGAQLASEIKARLAKQGLSQPDLALLLSKVAGVSCSQNEISKIETGERQRLNPRYVEALARILGLTRDEVAFGSPKAKIVRVLGEMLGDEAIRVLPEEEHLELDGFAPDADTLGYRVAVDTLEPRFRLDDILLCRQEGIALTDCVGRECVAEIDGRRCVGLVEAGASARVITLRPLRSGNPVLVDRTPSWISPILVTFPKPLAMRPYAIEDNPSMG